jgi:hypothetical protein
MLLSNISPALESAVSSLTLAEKRQALKALKDNIAATVALQREFKAVAKEDKAIRAEARRIAAIEKAQAKLDKLLSKPVGSKAVKANRKPSKPTVFQVEAREANEIAKKMAAKKVA